MDLVLEANRDNQGMRKGFDPNSGLVNILVKTFEQADRSFPSYGQVTRTKPSNISSRSYSCLVIMDWAMKFLPVQHREQMGELFGKRGRSWHISAVITRATVESKHEVECFVHIFNNCTQNSFAALSIIEDWLYNVKQKYPVVTTAYLRSHNAGCYHNGPLSEKQG